MTDSTKNNLSDAILIAALSAATYSIAFSYASGYAKYFKIPVDLITISPTLLLSAGSALIAAVFPMYLIVNAIWTFLPRSETILAREIRNAIVLILLLGFAISPYLINGELWLVYSVIIFVVIFFGFIFPLLTQRKITTFEKKLAAQDAISRNAAQFTFVGFLISRIGRTKVLFLFVLLGMSLFANILGGQEAKKKTEFLILKGDANTVILAQYDAFLISQSFDPKSQTLVGYMKISKISDGKEIETIPVKVGPLKPMTTAK